MHANRLILLLLLSAAMLMVSLARKFSLKKLVAMRRLVFGLGASQMVLTALGTGLVTWLGYGQGWRC